jgi:hypothetical protein
LIRVAVADPAPQVRLTIVENFDERYDPNFSLTNAAWRLFILLQDEIYGADPPPWRGCPDCL